MTKSTIDPVEAAWVRAMTAARRQAAGLPPEMKPKAPPGAPEQSLDLPMPEAPQSGGGQSLMDRAQDLMQKAAEREAVSVELAKKTTTKINLPKCPRGFVPVPNAILRSALFSVARARKRLENARIDAYGGDEIIFSGESLDQRDGAVWEALIVLAAEAGDRVIRITDRSLLKAAGLAEGGDNYPNLLNRLTRLTDGKLIIKTSGFLYKGSLIEAWDRDQKTQKLVIVIDLALAKMFVEEEFTLMNLGIRRGITRPLARWLYGFYSTHAGAGKIKVATIKRLCGSETAELWKFSQLLKEALGELATSVGWKWRMTDDDMLDIDRSPTHAQARHIRRKAAAARRKKGGLVGIGGVLNAASEPGEDDANGGDR
jgi:hypothetical protein